jgi:hypothetical protein
MFDDDIVEIYKDTVSQDAQDMILLQLTKNLGRIAVSLELLTKKTYQTEK